MIPLATLTAEAWNAIIIGLAGSLGTFVVARYTARRAADREDIDDGRAFRGELRSDNNDLRAELRELKVERDRLLERIVALDGELENLQESRAQRRMVDDAQESRIREIVRDSKEKFGDNSRAKS